MRGMITDVQVSEASSGALGGYLGNKGACALRLRVCGGGVRNGVRGHTLCFIAAHLAAHQHEVARRNADVTMILEKIQFPLMASAPRRHHLGLGRAWLRNGSVGVENHGAGEGGEGQRVVVVEEEEEQDAAGAAFHAGLEYHSVLESHAVFWMGDLNYRVDGFTWEEAHHLVKQLCLTALLAKDQLTVARAMGQPVRP